MKKIKVGIVGYGNLGKGVESAIMQNSDFELCAVFSNRAGQFETFSKAPVIESSEIEKYKKEIDVLFLCGGSANDVPKIAPNILKSFSFVDSYDNHSDILRYVEELNKIGEANKTLAICSTGWDPGVFSLMRAFYNAFLPNAEVHTFWGRGVSQGHSNAVRAISGVKNAIQYTIPKADAVALSKNGGCTLKGNEKHLRECFVVCDKKDEKRIENEIKTMPAYFAGYETIVNFISEKEFNKTHAGKLNHGGMVIGSGMHKGDEQSKIAFELELASNPKFTGSVMVAYGRALCKLKKQGVYGALTVLDVPPALLLNKERKELIESLV